MHVRPTIFFFWKGASDVSFFFFIWEGRMGWGGVGGRGGGFVVSSIFSIKIGRW
jgi:hypothetical protein